MARLIASTHTHTHNGRHWHTLIAPCQRPFAIFHYSAHHSLRRLKANAEKQPNGGRKKPLSTSCSLFAFTWGKQLKVLWISSCPVYVCVYWCFSRCVIWQRVYQSYATWTCHAIPHNVSMWALHFPPAPSDYLPTQSLDISYVSTNRRVSNIGAKQIYQEVFTYLIAAYKDLRAEVVLEMFFIVFRLGKLLRDIVN